MWGFFLVFFKFIDFFFLHSFIVALMSLCHSALLFSAATHFVPHVIAVFHAVTLIYCEPNFSITLFTVSRSVYP